MNIIPNKSKLTYKIYIFAEIWFCDNFAPWLHNDITTSFSNF